MSMRQKDKRRRSDATIQAEAGEQECRLAPNERCVSVKGALLVEQVSEVL
jgi:hypothetical protein